VLQASILDCGAFDPFSVYEDFLAASAIDVSRHEIVQALMIAAMIIAFDKAGDFGFEIAWK
jgi:hypothetical protein